MASQFANGKGRKSNRGGRRMVQSLPSIIFYRASTYRQTRTQPCPRTRARRRIINHYYLGVIFLRYNFVCLLPRVGARACTPRRRGQGSVSKGGAGSSLLVLFSFFAVFFVFDVVFFHVALRLLFSSDSFPSSTSRFVNSRHWLCVYTCLQLR